MKLPTAQNDPALVKRHEAAHALLDAALVPKAALSERIVLLIERERGAVVAIHLACAFAADQVASRFAKLGMEDAAAAARECAIAVRVAEPIGSPSAAAPRVSPVDPMVNVAKFIESRRQGMDDVIRKGIAAGFGDKAWLRGHGIAPKAEAQRALGIPTNHECLHDFRNAITGEQPASGGMVAKVRPTYRSSIKDGPLLAGEVVIALAPGEREKLDRGEFARGGVVAPFVGSPCQLTPSEVDREGVIVELAASDRGPEKFMPERSWFMDGGPCEAVVRISAWERDCVHGFLDSVKARGKVAPLLCAQRCSNDVLEVSVAGGHLLGTINEGLRMVTGELVVADPWVDYTLHMRGKLVRELAKLIEEARAAAPNPMDTFMALASANGHDVDPAHVAQMRAYLEQVAP